jgi:hypothetical protein
LSERPSVEATLRGAAEVEATLRGAAEVEATLRGAEVEADVEVQKPKMKQLVSTFVAVLSAVVASFSRD